jgi:3-hydroxybutyryl-CoA dehydrogenase
MAEALDVLVAGSGVMGRGIAKGFAAGGLKVGILSRDPARATPPAPGVAMLGALPEAPPRLVLESIPEQFDLKIELYRKIEAAYGARTILASNTSGLSLQDLADRTAHPNRFIGIHYFMPADVTPLVEVARVRQSDDDAIETPVAMLKACGKDVVVMTEPMVGLLVNRLQHAILHEAYHMIERGVVTAADVDLVARRLLGPRMSITGLIEQKDLSGLDTHAWAQAAIVPHLCHSATPSPVIMDKLKNNELGVKTGKGFYDWRARDGEAAKREGSAKLQKLLDFLETLR